MTGVQSNIEANDAMKEELQSSTSLQTPPPPRTVMDYIKGTLRYIGENPIKFAFSVGVGMAVSFGVKAGLIAMGLSLGPIGLAIGASMITSVILNVGKKLWKGEEIKLDDLAGKALFSGVFAGLIGGIFGTSFSDQLNDGFKDVPSGIHDGILPKGVTPLDVNLKPNLMAFDSQVANAQDSVPFNPYNTNLTDQYAYSANQSSWALTENYINQSNLDYISIKPSASHTLGQLLDADKDYYAFLNNNGSVDAIMTKAGLEELHCDIENAHGVAEIPQAEHIIVHNKQFLGASFEPTPFDDLHGRNLHINVATLTSSKDAAGYVIDHEIGHGVDILKKPFDFIMESKLHPSHHTELSADAFALKDGNYKGALEFCVDATKTKEHVLSSLVSKLSVSDVAPEVVSKIIKELNIEIDRSVLHSGDSRLIQQALVEKLKGLNGLDWAVAGDPHPSIHARMSEVLKHAAMDDKLNQPLFEQQLIDAQTKLNATGALNGKINLMDEWCKIKEVAIQGKDVAIATKDVTRDYSLAFSGDALAEQLAHLNTHTQPLSYVERLTTERQKATNLGLGV